MSVEIFSNENGAVFVCNTTDWAFGPKMPGENVAEAFLQTFQRPDDPRRYTDSELEAKWTAFQQRMICPFGHQEADVDTYSNQTVFSCMAKGCKAQWNLEGNVIEDEDEEDDLTEAERLGESRVMR